MFPLFLAGAEPTHWETLGRYVLANWALLWPLALGGAAAYLLLPQPRRSLRLLGGILGGLALVGVGGWFFPSETDLAETMLFYAFAVLAVVGGGLLITQRNPVHAALSFALVVLSTCGLFLLQAAPFLMAATIIIYAGAIIVTFLFVIMLAQQAGLSSADQRSREPFLATLAGFILLGALLVVLQKTYETQDFDGLLARVQQVAEAKTADDIKHLLGDPAQQPIGEKRLALIDDLQKYFPVSEATLLLAAEEHWNRMDVPNLTAKCKAIHDLGLKLRARKGSLQPDATLPLSSFSGTPPNQEPKGLPAKNVAGLGRALFTDYLLAVELAGTLLLVAAIGAIAIAGRRTEGLR